MDIDFFAVCATELKTLPSIVYENGGDGTFSIYPAPGTNIENHVWTSYSPEFDNKAAIADYDSDGFLNIFINSTMQTRSLGGTFLPGTPHQLLKNKGNSNHWLEIDLQGTLSNRDGIVSTVYVKVGGEIQMREHNGGAHRYAQNHSRLHFGLAHYSQIDEVTVYWPSGQMQTLNNILADQVLKIVEPKGQ